jgi:hypothetical protein
MVFTTKEKKEKKDIHEENIFLIYFVISTLIVLMFLGVVLT